MVQVEQSAKLGTVWKETWVQMPAQPLNGETGPSRTQMGTPRCCYESDLRSKDHRWLSQEDEESAG